MIKLISDEIDLWSYSSTKSYNMIKVKEVKMSDVLWRFACGDVFDNILSRFMSVLVCLVFSVLSTIEEYKGFANETLFWMVRPPIQFSESFWDKISDNNYPNFPNHFGPDLQSHYSESIHQNWPKCSFQKCLLKEMWAEQSSKSCIFCRKSVWWHFLEWSILYDFGLLGAGEIF